MERIDLAREAIEKIKNRLEAIKGFEVKAFEKGCCWEATDKNSSITISWFEDLPHLKMNEPSLIMSYDHSDRNNPLIESIMKILEEETRNLPEGVFEYGTYESNLPV